MNKLTKAFCEYTKRRYFLSFFMGIIAASASVPVAAYFFVESVELAATALVAIFLIFQMRNVLDQNRKAIWELQESPWKANAVLTGEITAIFFGIFVATFFLKAAFPEQFSAHSVSIERYFRNEFQPLFEHNFQVLLAGFILSLIYRSGGLILILAWNAINWAVSILGVMEYLVARSSTGVILRGVYSTLILPHLTLEIISYVIAGMAGVFLSIALFKYNFLSKKFFRVSRACLVLILVAVAVLLLATYVEIHIAQPAFKSLLSR